MSGSAVSEGACGGMSIQERIRAMNKMLEAGERSKPGNVYTGTRPSTVGVVGVGGHHFLETNASGSNTSPSSASFAPQAGYTHQKDSVTTEETAELSDDEYVPRRSSVVDMWRKREEAANKGTRITPAGNRPPSRSSSPVIVSRTPRGPPVHSVGVSTANNAGTRTVASSQQQPQPKDAGHGCSVFSEEKKEQSIDDLRQESHSPDHLDPSTKATDSSAPHDDAVSKDKAVGRRGTVIDMWKKKANESSGSHGNHSSAGAAATIGGDGSGKFPPLPANAPSETADKPVSSNRAVSSNQNGIPSQISQQSDNVHRTNVRKTEGAEEGRAPWKKSPTRVCPDLVVDTGTRETETDRPSVRSYRSNSHGSMNSFPRGPSPTSVAHSKSRGTVVDRWAKRESEQHDQSLPSSTKICQEKTVPSHQEQGKPSVEQNVLKPPAAGGPTPSPFGSVKAHWEQRFGAKSISAPKPMAQSPPRWKAQQVRQSNVSVDTAERSASNEPSPTGVTAHTDRYTTQSSSVSTVNPWTKKDREQTAGNGCSTTVPVTACSKATAEGLNSTDKRASLTSSITPTEASKAMIQTQSVTSSTPRRAPVPDDSTSKSTAVQNDPITCGTSIQTPSPEDKAKLSTPSSRAAQKKQLVMARYRQRMRSQVGGGTPRAQTAAGTTPTSDESADMQPNKQVNKHFSKQDNEGPRRSEETPSFGADARQILSVETLLSYRDDDANLTSPTETEYVSLGISDSDSFFLPEVGQRPIYALSPTSTNAVKPSFSEQQMKTPQETDMQSHVSANSAYSGLSQGTPGSSSTLASRALSVLAAQRQKRRENLPQRAGNAVAEQASHNERIQPTSVLPTQMPRDHPLSHHQHHPAEEQARFGGMRSDMQHRTPHPHYFPHPNYDVSSASAGCLSGQQLGAEHFHSAMTPLKGSATKASANDRSMVSDFDSDVDDPVTANPATARTQNTNNQASHFQRTVSPIARNRLGNPSFDSNTSGSSSMVPSTLGSSTVESTVASDSPNRRSTNRRNNSGFLGDKAMEDATRNMVPDKFVSESASNVNAFQSAYQSLSLGQIANDLRDEMAVSVAQVQKLASEFNQGVTAASDSLTKLVGTGVATNKFKLPETKSVPAVDEGVAIEVEFIENLEPAIPRRKKKSSSSSSKKKDKGQRHR